jgi:hypothetical protein
MSNNIIVITYSTGTGGSFLQQFLTLAKLESSRLIKFSKHGNAHSFMLADMPIEPGPVNGEFDEQKVKYILEAEPYVDSVEPYITISHIVDLKLVQTNFDKVIRITYDLEDIDEICCTHIGKFSYDEKLQTRLYSQKECNLRKLSLKLEQKLYTNEVIYPNVLYVSWKDLYKNDTQNLIEKLSNFTGFPIINFNLENLNNWRTATKEGIELVKNNLS